MKQKLIVAIVLFTICTNIIAVQNVNAQSNSTTNIQQSTIAEPELYTEIQSLGFTEVKSPIILTATPQFNIANYKQLKYNWNFGDGNSDEGHEVVHIYKEPGSYTVNLTVNADGKSYTQSKEIFVAIKAALLITDKDKEVNEIENIIKTAKESNIYITLVESFASQSEFLSEEVLAKKIGKQEDSISKMQTIIVWTDGGAGLNALARYKSASKQKNIYNNKTVILLLDDFTNLRRVSRQFNQLNPKEIIVLKKSGLYQLIYTPDTEKFKTELAKGGYDYEIITKEKTQITPFNILSYFIDFLTEKGIPDNTLALLLLLPVIATVIAFMKQVIGITTLGINTPAIITLTFLILGLKFGLIILLFIIAMGALAHRVLRSFNILYIPKMALILTAVSLIIFLLLTLTVYLNLFDIEFISLAIFPVVIMGTLTEKFVSLRSEKGLSGSMIIMIETFFVSFVAYLVAGGTVDLYFFSIQWDFVKNLVINTPEVIVIFILINIYLGKWTGLQLTEYFQFKDIINNLEE